ncbi:MAG TPA: NADH-ubiquinone oxidoreductase-F iron-sulfur binding region domain-containing protein [Pseudonocardia sp.]|nr:NADH-ubiquinone oxidoreductase-F iron-sulfur binding region domain-containing protein [Pseudonocardia sp.]
MTVGRHSAPAPAAAVPTPGPVPGVPRARPPLGPEHTQPIPLGGGHAAPAPAPVSPPAGPAPAAGLPRRNPGTDRVTGVPARGPVDPASVAGLGRVLSVEGVLGLDVDVSTSPPSPTGRIPGQRRPVQSSGPLPTVPPTALPPTALPPTALPPTVLPPTVPPSTLPSRTPRAGAPRPRRLAAPVLDAAGTAPPPGAAAWRTGVAALPVLPNPAPPQQAPPQQEPSVGSPAPRLLAGWIDTGQPADLEQHLLRYGELPRARFAGRRGAERLRELTEDAGLRGRGGAGFPTARKMAAVAGAATGRRRPVVVANGCESDPTSAKDQLLLHTAPHLVLDGLALAAHAVGADQAIICVPRGSALVEPLEDAVARRIEDPAQVHVVTTPRRFVSSEASALVNFLTTGDARPTSSPPLPAERGVQGRPTLLDNVETLAQLALLARHDADWFRTRGTADAPGTALVTVTGAVRRPGVYEVDLGSSAGQLIRLAGGLTGPAGGLLLGGLGGSWLPLAGAAGLALAYRGPGGTEPALGLASLLVLPAEVCGLAVTSAIVAYLAGESAGQCGPCMFGLPAVAADLTALAEGAPASTERADLLDRLHRRLGVIPGRGGCAHPDGATRLAASALRVFADDVAAHTGGRPCGRAGAAAVAELRELDHSDRGWR